MDWVAFWTAVAAAAAILAAAGTVGTLLAVTLQIQAARMDREDDYYRKLTPFLSFEATEVNSASVQQSIQATPGTQFPTLPAIAVYADGGGYAFNVEANIDQTNATSMQARLVGQRVLRYLRDNASMAKSLPTIPFSPHAAEGFRGVLKVKFVDMFGIHHEAHQAVRVGAGDRLETTDALKWVCGPTCRVHRIAPAPAPGLLTKLAQVLRLY